MTSFFCPHDSLCKWFVTIIHFSSPKSTTLTLLNVYVQNEAMKDQLFVKKRIIEDLRVVRERLHHQAQDIEVSLKNAESEYNRLINQMAPLHLLPDEILANIFEVGHAT